MNQSFYQNLWYRHQHLQLHPLTLAHTQWVRECVYLYVCLSTSISRSKPMSISISTWINHFVKIYDIAINIYNRIHLRLHTHTHTGSLAEIIRRLRSGEYQWRKRSRLQIRLHPIQGLVCITCIYVFLCMCVCVFMCVCMYVCIALYMYIALYIFIVLNIYSPTYLYMCIYILIYIGLGYILMYIGLGAGWGVGSGSVPPHLLVERRWNPNVWMDGWVGGLLRERERERERERDSTPHANSLIIGTAVINTHTRSSALRPMPSNKMFKSFGVCVVVCVYIHSHMHLCVSVCVCTYIGAGEWQGRRGQANLTFSKVLSSVTCIANILGFWLLRLFFFGFWLLRLFFLRWGQFGPELEWLALNEVYVGECTTEKKEKKLDWVALNQMYVGESRMSFSSVFRMCSFYATKLFLERFISF